MNLLFWFFKCAYVRVSTFSAAFVFSNNKTHLACQKTPKKMRKHDTSLISPNQVFILASEAALFLSYSTHVEGTKKNIIIR